jgi:rhamnose utilization protein RhaD (predicted bifunctional aldolase and dehydrogenase)
VIVIAASVNQEKLTKEIYGDEVIYTPWQRPGFDIGLKIEELIKDNLHARGILLEVDARRTPVAWLNAA